MKPFEEIREDMARAMNGAPDEDGRLITLVDAALLALAANGIDVARIAAGELKVVAREPTGPMTIRGRDTFERRTSTVIDDPVFDSVWRSMWDAAP